MITHYSIDLGIDANATGAANGKESDPYPLQIGLSQGTLIQDSSTGRYTGFEPKALASFAQVRSGDLIIFRVFDITSIGSKGDKAVEFPERFSIGLTNLGGTEQRPWIDTLVASISPRGLQTSLVFARGPKTSSWPCFFPLSPSEEIAVNQLAKVSEPTSFLLSVTVPVCLAGSTEPSYFRADPEMVVSPDEGPGARPSQSPAAATSR